MPDEMKGNTRLPSRVYRVPEFIELNSFAETELNKLKKPNELRGAVGLAKSLWAKQKEEKCIN